jgi:outer membrane protein OmpA-like peptidoglycan-associated protein
MEQSFQKTTFDPELKSVFLIVFLCLLVLIGCASLPGGSIKTYPSEYHTTVQASSDTLEELKILLTETIADGLKTTLKAQRADGTSVVVDVVRISRDSTQISVRTGGVGFGDKRVADQINGMIYQQLNQVKKKDDSRPEITEENLDDSANQQLDGTAPAAAAVYQVWDRSPEKVAAILKNSGLIIYFGPNSKQLSDKAKEKLDRVVEIVRNNPAVDIILNGYTDSYGDKHYNEMIAEQRALMVKAYLVDKGIESNKIQAFGHGSQKFIGSNKTLEGRQMNRRVEIEISGLKHIRS